MPDEEVKTLSAEEIAKLQEQAAKVGDLEKTHAETLAKLKEFEDDENSKDWRKARKKMEAMEKALNKEGKVLDPDTFEIKSEEREFSPEDVDKRAEAAVERGLINKSLLKAERDLSDEDKAIFRKFYEKAIHGETVNSDNVDDFIELAFKLGGSGTGSKSLSERGAGHRGGAPRIEKPSEDFADSDAGKDVLKKMGLPTESQTK